MTRRVLMTADTIGGVWSYACELIRALEPHDIAVTLATMGAPLSATQAQTAARLHNAEVIASSYALEWMPDPWRDVDAAGDWLLDIAARTRPDIVHLNSYVHAALPWSAPVITVAHSCVCTWLQAVRGIDPGPEWDVYRRRVACGLQVARAVVAPTGAILTAILGAYGVVTNGHVIANGRDPAAWPVGVKEPVILAAGRLWDEAKGFADLDACASEVAWPIFVAGPPTAPGGFAAAAPRHVELLGDLPPEGLASWMSRAAIYVRPARYEPFGISVLEAALAGCALVLGDLATLREVWGDAAIYVRPGDPGALAATLNALAADAPRRRVLAAAARERALQLSPGRMAAAYRALYDQVSAPVSHLEVYA